MLRSTHDKSVFVMVGVKMERMNQQRKTVLCSATGIGLINWPYDLEYAIFLLWILVSSSQKWRPFSVSPKLLGGFNEMSLKATSTQFLQHDAQYVNLSLYFGEGLLENLQWNVLIRYFKHWESKADLANRYSVERPFLQMENQPKWADMKSLCQGGKVKAK